MKKLSIILFATFLISGLVGCGNENQANQPMEEAISTDKVKSTEDVQVQSKYPFPENVQQIGTGKVSVQTSSGDSATGIIPVIFVEKDTIMTQIGYTLEGFDGNKEVFVYINKVFNSAEQAGELYQSSLDLEGDLLIPGDYIVTAIQFEGNDPQTGKVTHYSETSFTVKQGS